MSLSKRTYALNPITLGLHNQAKYEVQRSNHFEVLLALPTLISGDENSRKDWQKWLTLSISDFSLPNISFQPITIPYGNTKISLAGSVDFGGSDSITCTDFIGADTEGILYRWQNLIYNPETGQMGWAANYKTSAKVLEYSADGSCISSWILLGTWPSSIAYGSSLSKGDSQVKSITVGITYDLAYRKFGESTNRSETAANTFAASAGANMRWKEHDQYAMENAGGPLGVEGKPSFDEDQLGL